MWGRHRPHHLVRAHHVDCENPHEVVGRKSLQVGVGNYLGLGGIVYQSVDSAPPFHCIGRHPAAVFINRDVGLAQDYVCTEIPALIRRCLRFGFTPGVVDYDPVRP